MAEPAIGKEYAPCRSALALEDEDLKYRRTTGPEGKGTDEGAFEDHAPAEYADHALALRQRQQCRAMKSFTEFL